MQKILYYSEVKDPAVDWVFTFFSAAIGCTFLPTTEPKSAAVVYSNMQVRDDQFRIPVWYGYYDSHCEHYLQHNGYWIPREMQDSEPIIDYVGLAFRLLTLADEVSISLDLRDQTGNLSPELAFPRLDFRDRPMVDEVVHAMKQQLVRDCLLRESEVLPKWPDGKRYAVLLTHDTDGPCLLEPIELAKAGVKGLLHSDGPQTRAFRDGCWRIIRGQSDPYFNFAPWAEFEQALGARSAFYLYVKSKGVPNHLNNPRYVVGKKAKWGILRELADCGWEIGLHASMHALEMDRYIQTEKIDLEDFLGQSIVGNRCHYWCLDWLDPIASFRRLEATGFIYDCSVAWKDAPGFRSGTALPYHPYDRERNGSLKLSEIPTNLMDGHLFEYQAGSNPHAWFVSVVQQVRAYGGVLNLDWHTRTWVDRYSYSGWRSFLVKELSQIAETGEAWFATPKRLCEHWLQYERQLAGN